MPRTKTPKKTTAATDAKPTDAPKKTGRQKTEIDPQQVEKLAAVLTQSQIADYFGIKDRTLRDRMSTDDVLSAAYKRGRAKAVGTVAQSLIQQALSGNTTAMIFYLKTQAGWREVDTTKVEVGLTAADFTALAREAVSATDPSAEPPDADSTAPEPGAA